MAAFTAACLQTHLTSRQEMRVIRIIIGMQRQRNGYSRSNKLQVTGNIWQGKGVIGGGNEGALAPTLRMDEFCCRAALLDRHRSFTTSSVSNSTAT